MILTPPQNINENVSNNLDLECRKNTITNKFTNFQKNQKKDYLSTSKNNNIISAGNVSSHTTRAS